MFGHAARHTAAMLAGHVRRLFRGNGMMWDDCCTHGTPKWKMVQLHWNFIEVSHKADGDMSLNGHQRKTRMNNEIRRHNLFICLFFLQAQPIPLPSFFPFSPYIASVQSSFDNPTDVSYKTSILFKCLYIFFLFFVCVFMWKNPIQALLLGMLLQILVVCFHRCVCDDKIVCRFFERISAPLHHSHLQILTALREFPCSFWEIRFCPQTNTLLSRTEQFLCTLPFVSQSLITWNAALQLVYEKKMNCLHNIWHLNAAEGCIS